MNFYKHHIGDYAKKTIGLSMLEHGAYLLMLHAYYGTEKPLPFGRDLYRICRAFGLRERAAIDKVAELFWTRTEGGWINGRAFEEIEIAHKLRDIAVDNGGKGGRPKKPSGLSENNPAGSGSETQRVLKKKAIQTPDSTIQTPLTRKDSKTGGEETPRATRSAAPSRLADDFHLTEERYEYALGKGIEPESTFEAFRAYWHSKPKDNTKLDWDLTWQSWVLREAKDRRDRAGVRRNRFDEAMEHIDGK